MTVMPAESYVDFSSLAGGVVRMLGGAYRVDVTDDNLDPLKTGLLTTPAHRMRATGSPRCATAGSGRPA